MRMTKTAKILLPLAGALALAACGSEAEEEAPTYETDVVDESGGDLIVTEEDPNAVPVETPETAMTPAPGEAETPPAAGETAPE